MKAANPKSRSWRERGGVAAEGNGKAARGAGRAPVRDGQRPTASSHLNVVPGAESADLPGASTGQAAQSGKLSIRAENVLKILASELTGEAPPRGRWTPSDLLLRRLTYRHLSAARNCGPRTTAEIIAWARTRGIIIRRSRYTGKSLSAMWQDSVAKCSAGEITKAEVAEALENSTRRRSTRIPVALQRILLQLIRPSHD
jgi:hypothetical protein